MQPFIQSSAGRTTPTETCAKRRQACLDAMLTGPSRRVQYSSGYCSATFWNRSLNRPRSGRSLPWSVYALHHGFPKVFFASPVGRIPRRWLTLPMSSLCIPRRLLPLDTVPAGSGPPAPAGYAPRRWLSISAGKVGHNGRAGSAEVASSVEGEGSSGTPILSGRHQLGREKSAGHCQG